MCERKNQNAFTLIELLVVVSVLAVLAGILMSIIDYNKVRGTTRDGVRLSNMNKLVTGIEAFYASEGRYPNASGGSIHPDDESAFSVYVKSYPEAVADDGSINDEYAYKYYTYDDSGIIHALLSVKNSRSSDSADYCFVYDSAVGEIKWCKNCPDGTPSFTCTADLH